MCMHVCVCVCVCVCACVYEVFRGKKLLFSYMFEEYLTFSVTENKMLII